MNKMNRQDTEYEEIFANGTSEKGMISIIYKELNIKSNDNDNQIKMSYLL
jgi:hypothetical protein